MKRFRLGEEGEMESINMANVLMLLSRGADDGEPTADHRHPAPGRVFECKTCSRQFPSFQALGGHRASHKKPRLPGEGGGQAQGGGAAKPRVHECSICGLEFAIGQALGGHMRRHRAGADGLVEKKPDGKRGPALWFDLNLPPLEDETERRRKMGFGLQLVDKTTTLMVDCFQ